MSAVRHVQVIDAAESCLYPICAVSEAAFAAIFPAAGQDIAFIEDVRADLSPAALEAVFGEVRAGWVRKPEVVGIHGTLFCGLDFKKEIYLTKSERDVAGPPHSPLEPVRYIPDDPTMRNVQVIDDANNCTYSIYAFTPAQFAMIFPAPGQNVEFIEDIKYRLGRSNQDKAFAKVWTRRVAKPEVVGIHGTLFYGLRDRKRFYRRKSEPDRPRRPPF